MAQGQQLDTSGVVRADIDGMISPVGWEDLPNDFVRGFIRAMLLEFGHAWANDDGDLFVSYSDLAPEALDMIIRDCEAMQSGLLIGSGQDGGREAWASRQSGWKDWGTTPSHRFPPYRITLTEAGKVALT